MKKKILFLFMPGAYTEVAPLGPAIMQEVAVQQGYNSHFLDLNLDLYLKSKNNPSLKELNNIDNYKFSYTEAKNYITVCRQWYCQIKEHNADWIGISVFSLKSQALTLFFLKYLKKHPVPGKIIIGGAGINSPSSWSHKITSFGSELLDKKLVDFYILGEGELALAAILQGNYNYQSINSEHYEPIEDFTHVPIPNFDSFLLEYYQGHDSNEKLTLSVEGSRGCVRNCTFCDIKKVWKKFKYKDGPRLTQELLFLKNKYNVRNFWFNDSLINGSTKAYREFITSLAEYNEQQDDANKIKWSSQYIIKPKSATSANDIRLTKLSGGHTLAIGIESGSYAVRKHMGKNFTDEDIEYCFSLLREHDIKILLLMIVGYPTETEEDFVQTMQFFKKYKNLALEGTIIGVELGYTLDIIPGTPLAFQISELDIDFGSTNRIFWKNKNSDFKLRANRRVKAEEYIRELGYTCFNSKHELDFLRYTLKNYD